MNTIVSPGHTKALATLLLALAIGIHTGLAQITRVTVEQAVQQGLQHNQNIQASRYDVQAAGNLKKAASEISKLSVTGMIGQYNSYEKADNNITVSQSIPFPTVFGARSALGNARLKSSELKLAVTENDLTFQIKSVWYQLAYLHELNAWYTRQDSLLKKSAEVSALRQRTGEANLLEKVTAESRHLQVQTQLRQNEADIAIARKRLQILLNSPSDVDIEINTLTARPLPATDSAAVISNPQLQWYRQQITVAEKEKALEKNLMAPDLTLGYFNQTLIGAPLNETTTGLATKSDRFQGYIIGISIPLWFKPQTSRIRAAEYTRLSSQSRYEQEQRNYSGELTALTQEVTKLGSALAFYTNSALPQAELILKQADLTFRGGDISYVEYFQALNTAAELRAGYLQTLNLYNQAIINLEYLLAQR